MIAYEVSHVNFSGAFPNTVAVDATGPSATDGTEFIAAGINDAWGARQAIMDHAGLSPDGVTEAAGTAQIIEALQKGFGAPPGIITEWNRVNDPGTDGFRCLYVQGQGILIASYPDLVAANYVGDGNNATVAAGGGAYYKASDAAGTTPDTAGPYFILPESRGYTGRGLDAAATVDPDGASRFLGDVQADAFQGHIHDYYITPAGGGAQSIAVNQGSALTTPIDTDVPASDGVNGTPRTSSETRMANRSTKYVIWY